MTSSQAATAAISQPSRKTSAFCVVYTSTNATEVMFRSAKCGPPCLPFE
jgi:hypothetical protein